MNTRKVEFVFLTAFIILILIVLGFTGGMNIASFQKNHTESLVTSFTVAGGESVRKIEYAVKYGKPLTNFYGIEEKPWNSLQELKKYYWCFQMGG